MERNDSVSKALILRTFLRNLQDILQEFRQD